MGAQSQLQCGQKDLGRQRPTQILRNNSETYWWHHEDTQVLTLPGLDFRALDILEMSRDVFNVSFPFLVVPNFAPQNSRLFKVDYISMRSILTINILQQRLTFSNLTKISPYSANEGFIAFQAFFITDSAVNGGLSASIGQRLDTALIVRAATLRDVGTRSIALEVDDGNNRSIDR